MKYIFEIPSSIEVDRTLCKNLRGGICPSSNLIYFYGYGEICSELEDEIWSEIITHEHLHDLLYKNNISADFHHKIIYSMEPYIYYKSLED